MNQYITWIIMVLAYAALLAFYGQGRTLAGKGMKKFFKQPIMILPFLIKIILALIIITPILAYFAVGYNNLGLTDLQLRDATIVLQGMMSILTAKFVILAIISLLLLIFVMCFFSSGAIGMALEISNGKRTGTADMISYGKKFWFRYFLTYLLMILIFLALLIIAGLLFGLSETTKTKDILLTIYVILSLLFMAMFMLSPYTLIINNAGPRAAIKKSFAVAKKNYLFLILTMIIIYGSSWIISVIGGIAGDIINMLIIYPIGTLILMLFTLEKSGKEHSEEEKIAQTKKKKK